MAAVEKRPDGWGTFKGVLEASRALQYMGREVVLAHLACINDFTFACTRAHTQHTMCDSICDAILMHDAFAHASIRELYSTSVRNHSRSRSIRSNYVDKLLLISFFRAVELTWGCDPRPFGTAVHTLTCILQINNLYAPKHFGDFTHAHAVNVCPPTVEAPGTI